LIARPSFRGLPLNHQRGWSQAKNVKEERKNMKSLMTKRTLLTTVVAFAFVSAISLMASTSGAHFFSASGSVLDNGDLAISFDEAGLGNENITYTATANAQALYGCINGGGNHPQATNKEAVNATVSGGGTFQAKNGRVSASFNLPVPPAPASFSCPGGQVAVLASVSYTNTTLTDTTNGVTITQDDMTGTFSRTFFTFKK
jgi:hypothetical protein